MAVVNLIRLLLLPGRTHSPGYDLELLAGGGPTAGNLALESGDATHRYHPTLINPIRPPLMNPIRILSINLANGGAEPAALSDVLDEHSPDVVVAQELAPDCAGILQAHFDHGLVQPSLDFTGAAMVARYTISPKVLTLPRRSALRATLDMPHWDEVVDGFEVVSVHLTNPIERPLNQSRLARKKQVAGIARHIDDSSPGVVIGDMNATPAWPIYRSLKTLGTDAARYAGRPSRTWSRIKWMPAVLRIDHAFVRGASVVACQTARVRGTDHRALIVDLDLRDPGQSLPADD